MNLIVIVSDTYRYDNLAVGGGKARTPELDRFVSQANLFENCYVSSFPTLPNRTDAFTGRYSFPFHGWQPLDRDVPTLSSYLSASGYVCQLICDTPHLMSGANWYHRGFSGAHVLRGQEGDTYFTRMNQPLRKLMPDDKVDRTHLGFGGYSLADRHAWTNSEWVWEEDRFCARTSREVCMWLELNSEQDGFLLWVDMFDPHEPWDPPEYMVRWFDDSGYDGPPMIHPRYGMASHYTEAELVNMRAHYLAEASLVSKWVGHILRKIEDLGLMGNTAVVFTTDHGHYIGEHNWVGKVNRDEADPRRCILYRELSHIPLVVHVPGVQGGRVFPEIVQPPDLMPTLLELAGLHAPADVHGQSLLGLLQGRDGWRRRYAFSSFALTDHLDHREALPGVTDGRYSYYPRGVENTPELYELSSDPGENHSVVSDNPSQAREMHSDLVRFLRNIGTAEERISILG